MGRAPAAADDAHRGASTLVSPPRTPDTDHAGDDSDDGITAAPGSERTARRGGRGRPPLTRDRVVAAAVALADGAGIGDVTMRKLAGACGVEPMSLYHHVANKEDVLDAMVDDVFAEMELPDPALAWRDALARRAESARSVLVRHPWAIALLDSRTSPGPATLEHHDRTIEVLRRAGFSLDMVGHAIALLDAYVYGFAMQQVALPFDDGPGAAEVADAIVAALPKDAYPHLTEMATQHVQRPGYDFADEFAWGLEVILDGIAARLDR
jgi:AcrR family transcriptional regulator